MALKSGRGACVHLLHCCGIPVMDNCRANKQGLQQPIIFITVIYCQILDHFFFKSKNVNKWQIAVTVYFVYLADAFLQSNLHKMRSTMRIQTKKKKKIRVG